MIDQNPDSLPPQSTPSAIDQLLRKRQRLQQEIEAINQKLHELKNDAAPTDPKTLHGSVTILGDIVAPIDVEWEADA